MASLKGLFGAGLTAVFGLLAIAPVLAAPIPALIKRGDGTPATLQAIANATDFADVLYLGEEHANASGHQLELALLELAHRRAGGRGVALSLEMFERDVQGVVDEYLGDRIREKDLMSDARPWPNYASDYRPLVEYAKAHGLPVLAANAPKRYVSRVGRLGPSGLEGLSAQALGWLSPQPLPGASVAYASKFQAKMGPMAGHGGPGLLAAQVLRDATMAHTIDTYLGAHPGALVVQINGKFHSEGHLGVPEQLRRYRPAVRQLVVTMTATPEAGAAGDFVIETPRAAPKTL